MQIYLWVAPRLFLSSSCEAVWHQYGQVAIVAIVMSHYWWVTIAICDVTYGLIQCGLQQIFPFGLLNSGGDELSHVIRKDWARHRMAIFSRPMSHGRWLTGMSHIYMSGWYRVKKNATVLIEEIYSKIATCKGDYDVIMTSL